MHCRNVRLKTQRYCSSDLTRPPLVAELMREKCVPNLVPNFRSPPRDGNSIEGSIRLPFGSLQASFSLLSHKRYSHLQLYFINRGKGRGGDVHHALTDRKKLHQLFESGSVALFDRERQGKKERKRSLMRREREGGKKKGGEESPEKAFQTNRSPRTKRKNTTAVRIRRWTSLRSFQRRNGRSIPMRPIDR